MKGVKACTVLLAFWLSGAMWFPAHLEAQEAMQYYGAEVPVKSQTSAERRRASKIGLSQVLLRMSGSEKILQVAEIQSTIASKAARYVEQYQYAVLEDDTLKEQGYRAAIRLTFSSTLIERLLKNAGGDYWPANRPTTLVWLVEDSEALGYQLLNQASERAVIKAFSDAALKRGVPLIYPLLDLDDRLSLPAVKVWELDSEAILEASQRYKPDVVLVGRFSTTSSGQVWATWQFFHSGETRVYDSRANQEEALGEAGLFPLADFLASRYAIPSSQDFSTVLVMQVSGVNGFGEYRKTLDYLEGLAIVSDVVLSAVSQNTLLLNLYSDAGVERFLSALALDNKLMPETDMQDSSVPVWQRMAEGTQGNPLKYRWDAK